MRLGVVADDITGANDIGIMLAKGGYRTHVYPWQGEGTLARAPQVGQAEVLVLDTDSRFDAPDVAYRKVFAATRALQAAGCTQFYNKSCSVFRGNIGAEFDAMLDALGESFALVVLGFPKNGRLTVDGLHFVHGKVLEQSEFRHDPMHPMTRSNLVDILQAQTARPVALLTHEALAEGAERLRARIEAHRALGGLRVWREIQPGLPSCLVLGDPPRLLVLKSGSFGSPDFLERAIEHVAGGAASASGR